MTQDVPALAGMPVSPALVSVEMTMTHGVVLESPVSESANLYMVRGYI
jgi:hypothetical protein